jgi:hypothetical protein
MGEDRINVLHDFDNPYLSGRYALRRAFKLTLYALSKKLFFLRRFAAEIYSETYQYCRTMATLDLLLNIQSTFGLKDEVTAAFPTIANELRSLGFDVRRHYHISTKDVRWDPPLDVTPESWFFDRRYGEDRAIGLGKWAVFHADYPYLFSAYVDFLLQARKLGRL